MFRNLSIMQGARIAVETCMNVKPTETVLIVTDTKKVKIAEAFAYASASLGANTMISIMKPMKQHKEEPPKPIREAMKASDVVLMPTTKSLSHTDARREATEQEARIASMPEIREDMMSIGGLTADYKDIANRTTKIDKVLEKGKTVEVTTPSGTKLIMKN